MRIGKNIAFSLFIAVFILVSCVPIEQSDGTQNDQFNKGEFQSSTDSNMLIQDGTEGEYPDFIFYNANVLTMDQNMSEAEAVAIKDDSIFAVGKDEGIRQLTGSETIEIDLQGKTVLPGFIDSHGHWIGDDEYSAFENEEAIIAYMLENGWTSANELFVTPDRLEELLELDTAGKLRIRVNAYLPVNYLDQRFGRLYLDYTPHEKLSPRVRLAGVKFFTDNNWGQIINWEQAEFNEEIAAAHQAGWQVAIHNLSSAGVSIALEGLRLALDGEDNSTYRHRLEHLVAFTNQQLEEIQMHGYIASIQVSAPGTLIPDSDALVEIFGEDNTDQLFRWKDLYESGVVVIVSTDFPWFTNNSLKYQGSAPAGSPLRLIHEALTHEGPFDQTQEPWMDDQYPGREEVLRSLTINGAYATFEEDVKGSLSPGKYADMVILSENPLDVAVDDLIEIDVLTTIIAGKVEYCADGAQAICP